GSNSCIFSINTRNIPPLLIYSKSASPYPSPTTVRSSKDSSGLTTTRNPQAQIKNGLESLSQRRRKYSKKLHPEQRRGDRAGPCNSHAASLGSSSRHWPRRK